MSQNEPTFSSAEHGDAVTVIIQDASERSLEWFRPLTKAALRSVAGVSLPATEIFNKAGEGFDPVTEADRAVEDEIRARLTERFADHQIVGEERGTSGPDDAEFSWIIDPIDGTRAFITGRSEWGTLVGLRRNGVPVAGWLHQPTLGDTYAAIDGQVTLTTIVDGEPITRPISTRPTTALADATLLCTHPSMFGTTDDQAAFARVQSAVRLDLFSGDCMNYAHLAAGEADLVIENQLQPYDIIPLIPLIEAAGGVITGRNGASPLGGGWAIAAATPELHQAAIELLG